MIILPYDHLKSSEHENVFGLKTMTTMCLQMIAINGINA